MPIVMIGERLTSKAAKAIFVSAILDSAAATETLSSIVVPIQWKEPMTEQALWLAPVERQGEKWRDETKAAPQKHI